LDMEGIRQECDRVIDLLRYIWNSSPKDIVKKIRLKLSGVWGNCAEEQHLREAPRFVAGEARLLDRKIEYVDAPSYLFMRDEIFVSEIYRFTCNKQNPVIIDCGSNIGLSIIYFKKLYPDCILLCFEPDVNIFKVLSENVSAFGFQGVTLYNKAIWERETKVAFIQEGADGGRIGDGSPECSCCHVETTVLSQYLSVQVDFLKIDIEGAEAEVLEECREGLVNVNLLFLEYHSTHGEPQRLGRILDILTEAGFRYYIEHIGVTSKHPFVRLHTCNNFDNQLNIYAYR